MTAPHSVRTPLANERAVVLMLTLLAFAVRVYRLRASEFWFDEAGSYFIASKDYAAMFDYLRQAVSEHPPVYYLLLHEWMQWAGASEFALRYLSLIFGVLFVPLLYRFARREFGAHIGVGAALAATFAPFMVAYSQEARMYSLLPLLSLLALEAFLSVVRSARARAGLAFALISFVGLATHYYFALMFIGEFLFVLAQWRMLPRRWLVGWCVAMSVIAFALLAWLLAAPGFFTTLVASQRDSQTPPWIVRVDRVVRDMLVMPPLGYELDPLLRIVVLLGWLPSIFALRAPARTARAAQSRALLAALALGAIIGIAVLPRGVTGRQADVMMPAVLILLVCGVHELSQRSHTRGALAFAFMLLLFTFGLFQLTLTDKEDWGAALAQLDREAHAGDALIITKPTAWPTLMYYQRRADVPVYYLPQPDGDLSDDDITAFMLPILAQHARVWLAETGSNTLDPRNLTGQWLAQHTFAAQVDYFRAVSFYLFVNGSAGDAQRSGATFEPHIHLNSVQTSATALKASEALLLRLQWQSDARIPSDDLVVMQFVDERGVVWAERRVLPCGGHCLTSDWRANETIDDLEAFVIPPGTPPNTYRVLLSLYDPRARALLRVQNRDALAVLTVNVLPDPNALVPQTTHPLAARFDQALQLVGYDAAEQSVRAGQMWNADLTWRADAHVGADVRAVFQWLDAAEQLVAERELPIGTPTYPTSAWQPGEVIRQHFSVSVPNAARGSMQLAVQVREARTQRILRVVAPRAANSMLPSAYAASSESPTSERLLLTTVRVQQAEHRFVAPDVSHPLNVVLGEQAKLIGYQSSQSRSTLDVKLVWRALDSTTTRYKVFVHVLDAAEHVVAQHDAEPANSLRPTSEWQNGEYISDLHRINLNGVPAGEYRVEVGMYDAASGERLPLFARGAQQSDRRLILTTVRVP